MKLVLVACAVLLLILAGCTQQAAGPQNNGQPNNTQALPNTPITQPVNAAPAPKNCGTNMGCFRQALENNCQDAFALTTSGILHRIQFMEGNACAYNTAQQVNASTDEFLQALGAVLEVPIQKCAGAQNSSILVFSGRTKSVILPIETDAMNLTNKGYTITWYVNETKHNSCIYIQDDGKVLFFPYLQNSTTPSQ
ncbi:Uncharacterised protein [Candidatus Anstonella stagnisolia]|nr:Uncharacterised protein [Candidatus Anstonella stagnisolia]